MLFETGRRCHGSRPPAQTTHRGEPRGPGRPPSRWPTLDQAPWGPDADQLIGRLQPGLFALLLIVLEWTQPCLPSPLRPICDLRVLNHFIKEARDAEDAMRLCREGCSLPESVTVPQTRVDFDVWEMKTAEVRAQEVQSGLWRLQKALVLLRGAATNAAMHGHLDNSVRNLLSTNAVLRSLNFQEYVPATGGADGEDTWTASTALELLQVYVNFLRGKVHLLLSAAPACQPDVS